MKTIVKTTVLLATLILGATTLNAQNAYKTNRHEIRPFYGTAYASSDTDIFANTLSNGLLGIAEKSETTTFGMAGIGYRYHIKRLALGVDLGYSTATEELFKKRKRCETF
ncbi:hypothetical protein [Balneicella halophila]|nr:hypothetical protein [Balneicella halophila]